MNPKQKLINAIKLCGFIPGKTFFLQGTLGDNAYPDLFATYWTDYTSDNAHYDDDVHSVDWSFSVIIYGTTPEKIIEKADEIRAALKASGFIPQGKGQDIPSDEPTHTGWAMDFIFTEIQ